MVTAPRLLALLPLRLIVGLGFLVHGVAKLSRGPEGFGRLLDQIGVPFPLATAWMVTVIEVAGGLALIIGVFVAIACIPLIVTMVVAMVTVHLPHGFSSVQTIGLTADGPVYGPPGFEINLLYIGALIVLAVVGPGPLAALPGWPHGRKSEGDDPRPAERGDVRPIMPEWNRPTVH
jgi:putative oxidoreductase